MEQSHLPTAAFRAGSQSSKDQTLHMKVHCHQLQLPFRLFQPPPLGSPDGSLASFLSAALPPSAQPFKPCPGPTPHAPQGLGVVMYQLFLNSFPLGEILNLFGSVYCLSPCFFSTVKVVFLCCIQSLWVFSCAWLGMRACQQGWGPTAGHPLYLLL